MTYNETEYTSIIEKLFEMSNKGLPMDEIVKQTWLILKKIPIYPGIAVGCIDSMYEEIKQGDIKEGDFIVLYNKDGSYLSGTVEKKEAKKIFLKDVTFTKKLNSESVSVDNLTKIVRIKKTTLEETWPSLVFDKKDTNL